MPGIYFAVEIWCHRDENFLKSDHPWEYREVIITMKKGGIYLPSLRNHPPIEWNFIGNLMCEIECGWMACRLITWIGGLNFII